MTMSLRCLLACCRLAKERDDYQQIAHEYDRVIRRAQAADARVRAVLKELMQNTNRLCDRQLGGTYEEDARRSIAKAKEVL